MKYVHMKLKHFFSIIYGNPIEVYLTIFFDIALLASNPPLITINK